jgi:hypothetical protein
VVEKSEEKRPLGRPSRRREDIVKMNFKLAELDCVDWIHLQQGRNKRRVLMNLGNYTFEFHEMQKISEIAEVMLLFRYDSFFLVLLVVS